MLLKKLRERILSFGSSSGQLTIINDALNELVHLGRTDLGGVFLRVKELKDSLALYHSDQIIHGGRVLDVNHAAHVVLQLVVRELLQSILNQGHHLLSKPVEAGVRSLQKYVKVDDRAGRGVF